MRRIALSAAVGAAALLAVSIGLCQTPPGLPLPLNPSTQNIQPAGDREVPNLLPITGTALPAEKMTVKVYAVPDLIATLQPRPTPLPVTGDPELAKAMQQVHLQVQLAQKLVAPPAEVSDETTKKLERLKKAIRVAAPKQTWTEGGGEGEIEVYSEALSLIVRQTESGHEAICDLLKQLRATQNIQIELTLEVISPGSMKDEVAAEANKMLNRELSAEELVAFRKFGGTTAMSSVVQMANGRSANGGIAMPMMIFTAVATADRKVVEFRVDLPTPRDDAEAAAALSVTLPQPGTVTVGKTFSCMIGPDGDAILLVTPKVIDRSAGTAK
ncbi:MAG: hypothetical protein V4719_26265 [Planctomycetota bacterium]